MAVTPLRNVRVPDPLWNAALTKAAAEGTTVSHVLVNALTVYVNAKEPHDPDRPLRVLRPTPRS